MGRQRRSSGPPCSSHPSGSLGTDNLEPAWSWSSLTCLPQGDQVPVNAGEEPPRKPKSTRLMLAPASPGKLRKALKEFSGGKAAPRARDTHEPVSWKHTSEPAKRFQLGPAPGSLSSRRGASCVRAGEHLLRLLWQSHAPDKHIPLVNLCQRPETSPRFIPRCQCCLC